jgi:DNA-binding Lrp family transcriptional regulator
MSKHKPKWDPEEMKAAYDAAVRGMPVAKAAKMYGIPRTTLIDRLQGRVDLGAKWGRETVLPPEIEQSLTEYLKYMAQRGFPLTKAQVYTKLKKKLLYNVIFWY